MKKASSIILTIQVIVMYLIHVFIYLVVLLDNTNVNLNVFFYIILGLIIAMFPIGIISTIIALIGAIKGENDTVTPSIIAKATLIPWYIANFIICALICAGFLNPFLILAIPLLIFITVSLTFASMLLTSFHSLSRLIRLLVLKRITLNNTMIFAVLFHFIFCLDLVGAIMLKGIIKKEENNELV